MGALPKFADWTPQWGSDDADLDVTKVKKLIYDLLVKNEKTVAKLDEKDAEITELNGKVSEAVAAKAGTDDDAKQQIKDLLDKVKGFEEAAKAPRPQDQRTIDQLNVALELGLPKADARRLQGDTYDDILEDGKQFAADHGIELAGDGDQATGDAAGGDGRSGPPTREVKANLGSGFERQATTVPSNVRGAADIVDAIPL